MSKIDKYEEIKEIIEQYSKDYGYCEDEDLDFEDEDFEDEDFEDEPIVNFGYGIDDKFIDSAEKYLGYELSPTYKWWLKNYGGGTVYGEEIYTICHTEYTSEDTENVSDIIHINNLERKQGLSSDNMLIVSRGYDTEFYFDISKKNQITGEYPIYEFFSENLYAEDFIEFLKKRILNVY